MLKCPPGAFVAGRIKLLCNATPAVHAGVGWGGGGGPSCRVLEPPATALTLACSRSWNWMRSARVYGAGCCTLSGRSQGHHSGRSAYKGYKGSSGFGDGPSREAQAYGAHTQKPPARAHDCWAVPSASSWSTVTQTVVEFGLPLAECCTFPGQSQAHPPDQLLPEQCIEAMIVAFSRCSLLQVVELGRYEMDSWYYSPYPEPYASQHKLYICEFTLKYFRKKKTLIRHLAKLEVRHPPGELSKQG
eukprot:1142918-Pelagomonas_calceolata.AAC.2